MAVRRILQLGDPLLRQVSDPVLDPAAVSPLCADMRDTLRDFRRTHGFGRGISAVQIGIAQRVVYMEFEGVPWCLINPEWEHKSPETFSLWDDCFSFPDLLVFLERSQAVRVRYYNECGALKTLEAAGAFSELLQHEMDHLDGILAIDRALGGNSLCTRAEWQRRFALEKI